MNARTLASVAFTALAALLCSVAQAQSPVSENFTGATTTNQWLFYNGACLTAGSTAVSGSIGQSTTGGYTFPGCVGIAGSYYNENLVGGVDGYLGSSSAPSSPSQGTPDPSGQGALRFTNGHPGGYHQNGAIVSAWTFPTNQGIQIQFESVTYGGDSGGAGGDGADGISFYLIDGCMPIQGGTVPSSCAQRTANTAYGTTGTFPGIGSWGGSLAYSCSNSNYDYDGLVGAYLGLGIDEFGNFLNGTTNTIGETVVGGTSLNGASGDNTASGGGYQPGRIGLRGAGDVAWQALTNAYGLNQGSSYPYYPSSLATACSSGTLYGGMCNSCPSSSNGSGFSSGECYTCPNGDTYDPTHGTSSDPCASCPTTDDHTYTYDSTTGECTRTHNGTTTDESPDWSAQTTSAPSQTYTEAIYAVQTTCETGNLYNYSNPSSPAVVTTATLNNTANPANIVDYAAIPSAFQVLSTVLPSGIQLASETATTRTDCAANATSDNGCVVPIVYNLKITPAGLLSLSFSVNGGATQQVITDQLITTSNGPLPSSFRFGFAGSTGGDTNIHEVLCFKAQPSSLSEGSAGVNQKQSAKVQSGAFAYFSFYDPDNWTGRLTANQLQTSTSGGVTTLSIVATPTWDASCVLTGGNCASTTTSVTAEAPSSRVILTWNGTQGVPFKWDDLSSAEQSAIDSGDPSGETEPWTRVAFLRGDRTNEVNSSGTCPAASLSTAQPCFRERAGVLGDIVDSSPSWVGPPSSPYTASWGDRLYPTATMPENSGTNYAGFVTAEETRENVVYVGANDGLLHGFRSGAFNADGTFDTSAANDGSEVLAYMPGSTIQGAVVNAGTSCTTSGDSSGTSVVDTIHGTNPANCNAVTTNLDYSNAQYGHNFYVDATPGSGDLFYNGAWHTWLVGGMGPGGAVIYALDVTDPTTFSDTNAQSLVMGEWNPATISCANVTTTPGCGQNLGNTYGTPQIRRLHNGDWGVIFGNGFGSSSGDAGIYILTISPTATVTNGVPQGMTLYYLSTNTAGTNNGIAYTTPVDLDGDHITDYVYAGDLNGNIWRFDLTSSDPTQWGIQRCLDASCANAGTDYVTTPLFTTPTGQPITTQLVVASGQTTAGAQTLMIAFGTGEKTPFTNTGATSYTSSTTQAIYGIWDWAMVNWNSKSVTQYAALSASATGLGSSYTIPTPSTTSTQLAEQTFTVSTTGCSSTPPGASCGDRDITANATVCWQGTSACSSGTNNQFGWYVNLPGGSLTQGGPEQIVFNPELVGGAFVVNSTIPPTNTLLSCTTSTETGYTYALQVLSGGAFNNFFPLYNDYVAAGVATNASGTSFPVQTANGESWLVYQTYQPGSAPPAPLQINVAANSTGHRVTWTQLR